MPRPKFWQLSLRIGGRTLFLHRAHAYGFGRAKLDTHAHTKTRMQSFVSLQVEFDASDAASGAAAAEPRLLFCTQGGFLGAAAPASGPHPPQPQQNGFSGSSLVSQTLSCYCC